MQKTLSIVIPAYNVEKYLSECLDSIVKQDNGRIEIIVVNDGSTDSTWDVCCEYADKYDFVKTFTKENGGLSSARNFGIEKASGDYLFFIDSDDYICADAITKLFEKIDQNDSDVIVSLYDNLADSTGEIYDCGYRLDEKAVESLVGEDLLKYLMTGRVYDWYAVLQIVKKDYIVSNSLFFESGVTFEDVRWTPSVLIKAKKVAYIDYPIYIYRRNRVGSITATFSKKNFLSKLGVFDFIEKFALENNISQETKQMMFANMSNLYVSMLFETWDFPKAERNEYLNVLKDYKFILAKSARTYHNLLYKIWNFTGIIPVSYLLHIRAEWVRRKR